MGSVSDAGQRYTTTEMLERLVAFDTTSRNSNLALVDFVREYLAGHGVPHRISFDATGSKANIHAVLGPPVSGGIALSGHVDTVPVDGQTWSTDPFRLHRDGEKLRARGACDMKGFVAACLAALPELAARPLSRPLHLFISYDEEVGCHGAHRLVRDIAESGLKPELCIVGEPSGMQPVLAHKGKLSVRVTVRGRTGHSSEPAKAVNAVHAAAEAVAYLAAEARARAVRGPFEPGFDPPHTTIHVGTLHGGTALNVVPERAEFLMEWRVVPTDDAEVEFERLRAHVATEIEPEMHRVDRAAGFTYERQSWLPPMTLDPEHTLATLVKQLTGSNSTGKVSYGTEGGIYQEAGIATIVCGPGHIAQAHQPDEWIARHELDACDRFIRRLASRLQA
jgi:acetylornithine deacetylase